jgi:hypothetical protein
MDEAKVAYDQAVLEYYGPYAPMHRPRGEHSYAGRLMPEPLVPAPDIPRPRNRPAKRNDAAEAQLTEAAQQ